MSDTPRRKNPVNWTHGFTVEVEPFEKIAVRGTAAMPASSQRYAINSARKTAASRRAGRQTSRAAGGIHRRKNKRF
jgi:hypothetical protein